MIEILRSESGVVARDDAPHRSAGDLVVDGRRCLWFIAAFCAFGDYVNVAPSSRLAAYRKRHSGRIHRLYRFVDDVNLNPDGTTRDRSDGIVAVDGTPAIGSAPTGRHALLGRPDLATADGDDAGWEFAIPFGAIGASATSQFQLFVAYGNPDGENTDFSSHLIPDDGVDTSYEPNQDWTTVPKTQATGIDRLPVEWSTVDARLSGRSAVLEWTTASETNNSGFAAEHAVGRRSFSQIGWVDGAGTTTHAPPTALRPTISQRGSRNSACDRSTWTAPRV